MSSPPRSLCEESLNDSWVEVCSQAGSGSRTTPVPGHLGSGVEKMLLEAQKEGSQASFPSSKKSSEQGSPKTPCTPLSEYHHPGLNVLSTSGIARRRQGSTDWIWDWSSRPDILPPKEWKLHHPTKPSLSIRHSKTVKQLLSSEILSVLIITNILTLVLGCGVGIFLSKRISSAILAKVMK